jgi:hypothetical protein
MSENTSYSEVLREMQDIREEWRRNDYTYAEGQKARYEFLVEVRRLRVAQFYADGRVYVGPIQSK